MAGHGVGLQQRHAVDHVLALGDQGRVAVLPGVAAVEEQGAVRARGADRLEHGGDPVEAAELAVGLGERREILCGEGIGAGGAGRDFEQVEKRLAGDMRQLSARLAGADVDGRLAVQNRLELGVQVGEVNEGDVADRCAEPQQFILRQALLRECARPDAGDNGRRCRRDLEKFPPGDHPCSAPKLIARRV